jgi:hypothetical protein
MILFFALAGCATKILGSGDNMLRQYPVPMEFHIAEGATGNTQ